MGGARAGQGEAAGSRWGDLKPRVVTGVVLAVAGLSAIWIGGIVVAALSVAAAAAMAWELAGLMAPADRRFALIAGILAGLGVAGFAFAPGFFAAAIVFCLPLWGLARTERGRSWVFAGYGLLIVAGAMGVISVRAEAGAGTVFWLIGIVIAADIGGYFGGRLFGGPKFWPRVSPKKTWSGTVSGWFLAALIALIIGPSELPAVALALLSAALALVSQLGDIAESAVKRMVGAKDASALLPGHGGVLDRFDGAVAVFALALVLQYAPTVLRF